MLLLLHFKLIITFAATVQWWPLHNMMISWKIKRTAKFFFLEDPSLLFLAPLLQRTFKPDLLNGWAICSNNPDCVQPFRLGFLRTIFWFWGLENMLVSFVETFFLEGISKLEPVVHISEVSQHTLVSGLCTKYKIAATFSWSLVQGAFFSSQIVILFATILRFFVLEMFLQ